MGDGQHTVSIAFVRSAVHALDEPARREVLQRAGIAPTLLASDTARVAAGAFGALWMAVARHLDDEFFGLDSRRMKVGSFALLCHAVAGQATVERGLKLALRALGLFLDDISAELERAPRQARIVLHNRLPGGGAHAEDARRYADETLLVMVHGLLCWMCGRRVALQQLHWGHAAPAHADEYRRMFTPQIEFGAPASAAVFAPQVLDAPLAITPAGLRAFLRDAPQSVFLKQVSHGSWGERARRQLRRQFRAGAPQTGDGPTLEGLATQFGLSAATLRRRLDEEGTGWQQLKDEVRRDLAIHRLADGGSSVGEVAVALGFTDASSFHRAFRKWTGASPGAYRTRGR